MRNQLYYVSWKEIYDMKKGLNKKSSSFIAEIHGKTPKIYKIIYRK